MPVYQPTTQNASYQHALMQQLGTQTYVPVSCEYGGTSASTTTTAATLPSPPSDNNNNANPARIITTTTTASSPLNNSNNSTSDNNSSSVTSLSSTNTSSSSPCNALVPVNSSSKEPVVQSLPVSSHHHYANHAIAANPAFSNMFSLPGYPLNKATIRPTIRTNPMFAQPPPSVAMNPSNVAMNPSSVAMNATNIAMNPYAAFPPQAPQALAVNYASNVGAGVVQYPTQTPASYPTAAYHTGGLSTAVAGAGLPASGVGSGASVTPNSLVYPSLPYNPLANFVLPQHAAPPAAAGYTSLAAAAAQAAAAAAAGATPEQPFKKLKTI